MLRFLLVLLVGCGGGAMYDVRLINRTDHTLEAVYVYPTAAPDRGASRATLAPNAEAVLKIAAGSVDVVLLPESAVNESELDDLETLLGRHGVTMLVAGVRAPTSPTGPASGR